MSNAASSLMTGLRLNSIATREAYSEVSTAYTISNIIALRAPSNLLWSYDASASIPILIIFRRSTSYQHCEREAIAESPSNVPNRTFKSLARLPTETTLGMKTSTWIGLCAFATFFFCSFSLIPERELVTRE